MIKELFNLPNDPELLKQELVKSLDQIQQLKNTIAVLHEEVMYLRNKRFAPKSEKSVDGIQTSYFDEAELEECIAETEQALDQATDGLEPETKKKPKKKGGRKPLPKNLVRIETIIDVTAEEKKQLEANGFKEIGYEVSEQLHVVPGKSYVVKYMRVKYAKSIKGESGIKLAPPAKQMIDKCIAGSSLLASIVTNKFVDSLPLYRQEKIFKRQGIEISRANMANWMTQISTKLQPLFDLMNQQLLKTNKIHIDETTVQVMHEPGRKNQTKSYMWVYSGGPPDKPVVLFHYEPTRSSDIPYDFLINKLNYKGYIQTDGYAGYNTLANHENISGRAGCWVHVRRKFDDAAKGRKSLDSPAKKAVRIIRQLYGIEDKLKRLQQNQKLAYRQKHAKPIIDKFHSWLKLQKERTLPKGLMGKAISYALSQWPYLETYLKDINIKIDNNAIENSIRPFAVGRKNWLFSGSPKGAQASANLYSLVETAKANGLEPFAYLNYLFEYFPHAESKSDIAALLPFNLNQDDIKIKTPDI